ncbi:tetratricopeptide repeat protein [Calditrichota bacterium]
MNHSFRKATVISLALILCASLMLLPSSVRAQEEAPESGSYEAGLQLLPDDLHDRWNSLVDHADSTVRVTYIEEGRQVIRQLATLVDVVGGTPPKPGEASYAVYVGTLNRLMQLLDNIELATVLQMAEDDYLVELLNEYREEKDQISEELRADRQKLIDDGAQRIREYLQDPAYRQDPLRREVIADLYFRLAELNYKETEDRFGDQLDEYTNKLNQYMETDPGRVSELVSPVKDNRRVLTIYQKIVDEFADTQYGVDALYNIAVLTAESQDPADKATANQYFETLVELYPGNRYTLNALRRIGDYYFNPPVNNIERAVAIYERIARDFKEDERYTESLYMLGWCHYRLSELPKAVEYFAKVLDNGYTSDGEVIKKREVQDFAPDALKYIGICYSVDVLEWETAGLDGLVQWLQTHPIRMRNYGPDAVKQLGDIYAVERGQYPEGIEAYERFLELFPLEPRAPEIQLAVLNIFLEGLIYDIDRAHLEMVIFYDNYNPDSEWWAANEDVQLRRTLIPKLENHCNTVINDKLAMAFDNSDSTQYRLWETYTRQYLRFWPTGPNAYTNHANLAIILQQKLGRPMDAMREWWQVATSYSDTSKLEQACENVAKIAIDFAVKELRGEIYVSPEGDILPPEMKPAAAMESVPSDIDVVEAAGDTSMVSDTTAADDDPRVVKRTALYHSEELELSAFDLYLTEFPAGELASLILYTAGNLLFSHDWIPESRPYFEQLIVEYPDSKFLESSYTQLLEGYFKSRDLRGVETMAARIMETDALSQELKDAAYERKAYSILSNATNLKDSGDHLAAAEEFLRVANEAAKYEQADAALFQAGLEFAMAKEFLRANEAYLLLVERYPASDRADKALYNVALHLQNDLDSFAEAAAAFERLADEYPSTDQLQAALASASVNYDKVDDHLSVIRINERYIATYPDADDADIYLFEMADHHLKLDDIESANRIYSRFAQLYPDDPRTVQAFFERGAYYHRQDNRNQAITEFTQTVAAHDRQVQAGKNGMPKYASLALNQLITWEHEGYSGLKLTGSTSQIENLKARKTALRDTLIERYRKLTIYGMKEGYRAYYEIGRLFEEQATATFDQDVPFIEDLTSRWEVVDKIVDESIALNITTQGQYVEGHKQLSVITTNLDSFRTVSKTDYDKFAAMVSEMQTDTLAVGLPDSVAKMGRMEESLAELDSAYNYSVRWADACKVKIPDIASRNGDYLTRAWVERFAYRSAEREAEIRMLFREEVLTGVLTPMAPEVLGFYLQALQVTEETDVDVEQWSGYIEERFSFSMDTLFAQWDEQVDLAGNKADGYYNEYLSMLERGEWAESREGFYLDMMGEMILVWLEYMKTFDSDMLKSFTVLLDTIQTYDYPYNYAGSAMDRPLVQTLNEYDRYVSFAKKADSLSTYCTNHYDENPYWYDRDLEEEVDAYWWLDAARAFEDVAATFHDYAIVLLEDALAVRDEYSLPGLAGISILRKLVELRPEEYASKVGIEPKVYSLTSDSEWKIWPLWETDFEKLEYDDSEWQAVSVAGFPGGYDFGILDSLNAMAMWHSQEEPAALPIWHYTPESISGNEGELIEFTIMGTVKERGGIPVDEYADDDYYEDEYTDEEGLESAETDTTEAIEEIEVTPPDVPMDASLRLEYSSMDLPYEATFTDNGDGTGTFMWTPGYIDDGEYTAKFMLYNYDIPVSIEIPISVSNVDRGFSWIDVPQEYVTDEGLPVDFTVMGEDPDGDQLTIEFSSPDLPETAVFTDNLDGSASIYWETGYEDEGEYSASFLLSDGDTVLAATVPITVLNAVRAPRWVDVPMDISGEQNVAIEFTVSAQHPDALPLTISYYSEYIPATSTFADNGDGTASFAWTPTFEDEGTYAAQFTLSDGETLADTTVTIFIGAVARPPNWTSVPAEISAGEGEAVDFEVAGSHPNGEPLTLTYTSLDIPETAQFMDYGDGTGSFFWQSEFGNEGSFTASFNLSDGILSVDTSVTVYIGAVARPPSWFDVPTEASAAEGELVEFTVMGESPDGLPLTISYTSETIPADAAFTDNGDGSGSFYWQTTDGQEGSYTASFTLSDGTMETETSIPIYVGGVAKPPVWVDVPSESFGNEGDFIEFSVVGDHPDGLPLTIEYTSIDIPGTAGFTDNGDGTGYFGWQTESGDAGSYTATLTLFDGEMSAEATVFLTVTGVALPPEWSDVPSTVSGTENELIEFSVNGYHPDGLPLTISYSAIEMPGEATFVDNGDGTGMFMWTPQPGDAGDWSVMFTLSDGSMSVDAGVTLSIAAAPVEAAEPPQWTDIPSEVTGVSGELLEFSVFASSSSDMPLSISYVSDDIPDDANFSDYSDGTGTFSWDVPFDYNGIFTAYFTLSDGENDVEATVTLDIAGGVLAEPVWDNVPSEVTGITGELLEFSVSGYDPGEQPLYIYFYSENLPEEAQFVDNGDGTGYFTWIPTDDDAGFFTLTLTLSNGGADAFINIDVIVVASDE